ncbi:MAG: GNAT family N-acetyltransferase [Bacillota bacterium]|jgi:riboflavin biosynthesis RibT protein|uniref:GNAT family N-acetyltransferase n=1 Tax=Bacillus sp. RO2 TaxID=2723913 RepID=UPI00145E2A1F|nr:GNAT family N-acetyltransferase [Bacillus sp. RO2]MEA3322579.1 GNAT family N-acetyltransferase [Bacillota bacterium]NMH74014.1 GNAT family N-acetyltransferase [Bacillus sp. RO2]
MLIRYKKSFEKIAMGLMSFMPTEKELKKLQQSMRDYEEKENWQLFLWKEDDIIGLIGIELEEDSFTIQHISVIPSHRGQGFGKKMVVALTQTYPNKVVKTTQYTTAFIEKCDLNEDECSD